MITYPPEMLPEAEDGDTVQVIVESDAETYRRGRAAGMREAITILSGSPYSNFGDIERLRSVADKIEKGAP